MLFRRRAQPRATLDRAALLQNCEAVVSALAEDFDWRRVDLRGLALRVAARAERLLSDDPSLGEDLHALGRLLETEASAEYFAGLYDQLEKGGAARQDALTELFRPEEQHGPDGSCTVYRGYLYRAAVFYVQRWTGRHGWSPSQETVDDLARTAAEDVLMALLRSVDLRAGRRAFWSYLSRAVERRTIDGLRALNRRGSAVSLDELAARTGGEVAVGGALDTGEADPMESVAASGDLSRLMDAARLSPEERFALMAGAYGLNDTESAEELSKRLGRRAGPADIRRWRFRGREKLKKVAEGEV